MNNKERRWLKVPLLRGFQPVSQSSSTGRTGRLQTGLSPWQLRTTCDVAPEKDFKMKDVFLWICVCRVQSFHADFLRAESFFLSPPTVVVMETLKKNKHLTVSFDPMLCKISECFLRVTLVTTRLCVRFLFVIVVSLLWLIQSSSILKHIHASSHSSVTLRVFSYEGHPWKMKHLIFDAVFWRLMLGYSSTWHQEDVAYHQWFHSLTAVIPLQGVLNLTFQFIFYSTLVYPTRWN